MIDINTMREKYDRFVFWGSLEPALIKYSGYIKKDDIIIDSDSKKQGKKIMGVEIFQPNKLIEVNMKKTALIILAMNFEEDIYLTARRIGFSGDVYSDDMINFNSDLHKTKPYVVAEGKYTVEKHTQILISLLKEYGVKNIVVSPGSSNINFVYSLQNDAFFKLWSCIDERSAGYMACGIAQSTGEPVALSCTGATASRNYMSALTEAYYSKLPVIAITSSRDSFMIGNGIEQVTDRSGEIGKDIVRISIEVSPIHNEVEKKYCELNINRALSMLKMNGGGPVHINLITRFKRDFSAKTLPKCRTINTITGDDILPVLSGKIALYLRPSLELRDKKLVEMIEIFCEKYNAVVIGDHLSNYDGKYFVDIRLITEQSIKTEFDVLIYAGTLNSDIGLVSKKSWRISTDGNLEDPFLNLEYYFNMSLMTFVGYYNKQLTKRGDAKLYSELKCLNEKAISNISELPFSNLWVAQQMTKDIPQESICYFGIYSSLHNWNYFPIDKTVKCYSTVGGYGIDGTLSAMIGASMVNPTHLCFCFMGDLSFFYDMNVLGNRNIQNNVRIMVFNNNGGNSLIYDNGLPSADVSGQYAGAMNHFKKGRESILKDFSEALGFEYLLAKEKDDFLKYKGEFLSANQRPILFEINYCTQNDYDALNILMNGR